MNISFVALLCCPLYNLCASLSTVIALNLSMSL